MEAINELKALMLSDGCTPDELAWVTLLQVYAYQAKTKGELERFDSHYQIHLCKEWHHVKNR